MIIHYEILDRVARHTQWNFKKIPHESSMNHLGYGDIHLSLLALHKPNNILAIGSQYGFIPAILGMMAKSYGARLDFVDANYDETTMGPQAFGGHGYWTPEHQQGFVKAFDLDGTIHFHIETTRAFFQKNRRRYQYAYLDGDHSYEGVRYDFEQAKLCCDPGSFITLHDAKVSDGWYGCSFGVGKLLASIPLPHIIIGTFPGLAIVQV